MQCFWAHTSKGAYMCIHKINGILNYFGFWLVTLNWHFWHVWSWHCFKSLHEVFFGWPNLCDLNFQAVLVWRIGYENTSLGLHCCSCALLSPLLSTQFRCWNLVWVSVSPTVAWFLHPMHHHHHHHPCLQEKQNAFLQVNPFQLAHKKKKWEKKKKEKWKRKNLNPPPPWGVLIIIILITL